MWPAECEHSYKLAMRLTLAKSPDHRGPGSHLHKVSGWVIGIQESL